MKITIQAVRGGKPELEVAMTFDPYRDIGNFGVIEEEMLKGLAGACLDRDYVPREISLLVVKNDGEETRVGSEELLAKFIEACAQTSFHVCESCIKPDERLTPGMGEVPGWEETCRRCGKEKQMVFVSPVV